MFHTVLYGDREEEEVALQTCSYVSYDFMFKKTLPKSAVISLNHTDGGFNRENCLMPAYLTLEHLLQNTKVF